MTVMCDKCGKEFSHQQQLAFHLKRKVPCTANTQPQSVSAKIELPQKTEALQAQGEQPAQPQSTLVILNNPIPELPPELAATAPQLPATSSSAQNAPASGPIIIDEAAVKLLLNAPYEFMAIRTGWEGWKGTYDDKDIAGITPVANRVISKHAPEWLKKNGDEVTLAVALVVPLLAKSQEYMAWKKKQKEGQQAAPAAGVVHEAKQL